MSSTPSVDLVCPDCGGAQFEISILKDEELGLAKCLQCERNYLLLDSRDYWFDAIQQRPYPRASRCGCAATAFRLRLKYEFGDDGDIRSIECWSTCTACGKSRRQLRIDIDYSPTDHLVEQPLTYCKNPKILYDLHELSLYARPADIASIIRYLNDEAGCQFAACARNNGDWQTSLVDIDRAEELIRKQTESSNRYLWIYASPQPLQISKAAIGTAKQQESYWKRREIIRISSPTYMLLGGVSARPSLLYYIHFSNELIKNEKVIAKPQRFRHLTAQLMEWLKSEFVTWRGTDCFDNVKEHARAFGDRYRTKAEKKSGRK